MIVYLDITLLINYGILLCSISLANLAINQKQTFLTFLLPFPFLIVFLFFYFEYYQFWALLVLILVLIVFKKINGLIFGIISILFYLIFSSFLALFEGALFFNFCYLANDVKSLWGLCYLIGLNLSFYLILFLFKKILVLNRLKYPIKIEIEERTIKLLAYYDSGNTLLYKGLPVLFLTNDFAHLFSNAKQLVNIQSVTTVTTKPIKKAKVITKNTKINKDIYVSLSNADNFNGCNCLLNAYVKGWCL